MSKLWLACSVAWLIAFIHYLLLLKEYAERQVHATHPALYIAVGCCMLLSAVMLTICTVEAARA
jgi:hypothetical protein